MQPTREAGYRGPSGGVPRGLHRRQAGGLGVRRPNRGEVDGLLGRKHEARNTRGGDDKVASGRTPPAGLRRHAETASGKNPGATPGRVSKAGFVASMPEVVSELVAESAGNAERTDTTTGDAAEVVPVKMAESAPEGHSSVLPESVVGNDSAPREGTEARSVDTAQGHTVQRVSGDDGPAEPVGGGTDAAAVSGEGSDAASCNGIEAAEAASGGGEEGLSSGGDAVSSEEDEAVSSEDDDATCSSEDDDDASGRQRQRDAPANKKAKAMLQQAPDYYDEVDISVGSFLFDLENEVIRLPGVGHPRSWQRLNDSDRNDSDCDRNDEGGEDSDSSESCVQVRAVLFLRRMCSMIRSRAPELGLDSTGCLVGCLRLSLRRVLDIAKNTTHDWNDRDFRRDAEVIAETVLRTEYDIDSNFMLPLLPEARTRSQRLTNNPRVTIERCDDDYRRLKAGEADVAGQFAVEKLQASALNADAPPLSACDLDFLAVDADAVQLCQILSQNVQSPYYPAFGGARGPKRSSSPLLRQDHVYLGKVEVLTGFSAHMYVSPSLVRGRRLSHWLTDVVGKSADEVATVMHEWQRHPVSFLTKCIASGKLGDVLNVNPPAGDPTDDSVFTFPTDSDLSADRNSYRFRTRPSGLALNEAEDGTVHSASGHRGSRQKFCFEDLVYLLRLLSDGKVPVVSLHHFGEKLSLERTTAVLNIVRQCRVPHAPMYAGVGCNQLESEAATAGRRMQDFLMFSLQQPAAGARVRGCKCENFPTGAGASMFWGDDDGPPEMRYGNSVVRLDNKVRSRGRAPLLQAFLKVFGRPGHGDDILGRHFGTVYDVTCYSSVSYIIFHFKLHITWE